MAEKTNTLINLNEKLPQNLQVYIVEIAKKQRFQYYEIVFKKISPDGGSYMGVLYEIDLKGKITDDDEVQVINIFVKNIVDNFQMPLYSIPGVFKTEAWVYTELKNVFTELQDDANISANERFQMAYGFDECNQKSIILEHSGKRGFKLFNKMYIMPLPYAVNCIKEVAKFHALSFVIQEKRPQYFTKEIKSKLQPYNFAEDWYSYVENVAIFSINCLSLEVRDSVKESLLKKAADYPKYMTDTSNVRTLCHGDYKLNNVMAKEVDGKTAEVIPIDYQILHYGCPILDFIYFLFHGTDQEFRRNHLIDLKDLYYATLKDFVEKFDINIDQYFPRAEFERVYKNKLDFGLMVNIFFSPFLFAIEGDAPDITTEELTTLKLNVDPRFTERFRGIVDDFIQWGYI